MWQIHPGEIARRISELDMMNLDTVSGLVIQPGITALVYIDGREVVQLSSGAYDFVDDGRIRVEMERKAEASNVKGVLARVWNSLLRMITGRRKDGQPGPIDRNDPKVLEIIGKLNANSSIAVYLKRDTNFPALFGSKTDSDGKMVLEPILVRTRILDAKVGVHMFVRVGDFQAFIRKYLLERKSAMFTDIQDDLDVYVRGILQDELSGEEVDDYGIGAGAKARIAERLKEAAQHADGIEFVRLAEVFCSNEEFDRFRKLSQELWCSEKELDYLRRSNEFQNRLAREVNAKKIVDARNEQELKSALRDIDRDNLLSEDEFDAFVSALAIKKFNRNQEMEIEKIKGAGDIQSAELAVLTNLSLQQIEADERIYASTHRLELQKLKDSREMNQVGLEIQRDNDDYADERRSKDLAHTREKLDLALDIDERMNSQEQKNLDNDVARRLALEEEARKREQDRLAHEENLANIHKGYSAEQLMAAKLDKLDAGAQAKFAESFVSKKDEEAARATQKVYEDAMARMGQERSDIIELARNFGMANASVAGAQIARADAQKSEYREDARYQQSRVDHTQDKALEYVSKVNAPAGRSAGESPAKPAPAVSECPSCGAKVEKTDKECPVCGAKLS
ncbi:MAG: zinc-ribbon domain-containing protein [Bacteroidales bacterium]|nr:zinc-ribbon domain-containing protein [Bacteroidales bacterium]